VIEQPIHGRPRRSGRIRILLFCVGLLCAIGAVVPAGAAVRLENKHLRLTFDEARGFALTELMHLGRQTAFVGDRPGPLWRLTFRDGAGNELLIAADTAATRRAEPAPGRLTLVWEGIRAGQGTARVRATLSLGPEAKLSEWRLALDWTDPKLTLRQVEFPRIAGIRKVAEDDALTLPIYWGRLATDPLRRLDRYTVTYPCSGSMQYASYYGGGVGLYVAAADPDCWMKHLQWSADTKAAVGDLSLLLPAPDPLPKPRQWEIPYPAMVGIFDGDWYDSAQVYREWALRQKWCAEGPIATRRSIPAWFKEVALWLKYYNEPGKVLGELADHFEYLRVPTAVHYYRYPVAKFDDNYPEMLPAKPGYLEGVRAMQALGAHVIPYTQGSIWDMDTESWRLEGGASAAAKTETGDFYKWQIAENTFAWMCPFTKKWQEKVVDFVGKQVWDYGLDGVYLDVLAAGRARPCFDQGHGHPLDGGTYWGEGNRVLMQRLRERIRERKPEAVFTTEEICEAYLDGFDGFLTLDVTRGGYTPLLTLCPLFTAVYHDYAIQYGSDCALSQETDTFCALMAEHLAWGAVPTLSENAPPKIGEKPESAAYLRAATHCFHAGRKFLLEGKWLRPPALDVPARKTTVGFSHRATVSMPVVRHSLWRAPDGSIGLLLTNWTGEVQPVSLHCDPVAWGLPSGSTRPRQLWPAQDDTGVVEMGPDGTLRAQLAPRSALLLEFGGKEAAAAPTQADLPFLFLRQGKDGAFPQTRVEPGSLWYAEGAELEIAPDGTLTATGTRADQDFLLALRHSATIEPPVRVRMADASRGGLVVSVDGARVLQLRGVEGLQVVARDATGALATLSPGKDFARLAPGATWHELHLPLQAIPGLTPSPQTGRYDLRALAKRSRELAQQCHQLALARATLPQLEEAERQRAAVCAAISAQTGARIRLSVAAGVRLAPFIPCQVDVECQLGAGGQLVSEPRLTVARAARPEAVTIRPKPGARQPGQFEVVVTDRRLVEHTVTLLAEAQVRVGNESFTLVDQVTLPCDIPFLAALAERKRTLVAGRSAEVAVGIRNVMPHEIQVRSRPVLPKGWSWQPAEPETVTVGPAGLQPGTGVVRLTVTAAPDARPGTVRLPIETSYTGAAGSSVFCELACDLLPKLAPVAGDPAEFAPTPTPARIRQRGRALLYAEAGETISLKVSNVRVTTFRDTASYRLLDPDLKELAKGTVKVDETATISVKAEVSGTHFLEVVPKGGSCTIESENRCLVIEASESEPLQVIYQMPVSYIHVPADAREFILRVKCGGETEPVDLVLTDPSGREVLRQSGALLGNEYKISVPAEGRGKAWKLSMSPREDVSLVLTGDVVPFLADHPARLLK
jgi:hypothetical protein